MKVVFRSSAASLVAAHSSSSSCTGLRCRLPLSNHRVQMFHSFSPSLPFLPVRATSLFDCAAFVVVSLSPSETFTVTVPRATRTSSAVATLEHRPPRLSAPPTRSTVCRWRSPTRTSFLGVVRSPGLPVVMVVALLVPL